MTITKVTIGSICKETGLTKAQVLYRLQHLGIDGEHVQPNIKLYDYSVIKRVRECVLPSERKE